MNHAQPMTKSFPQSHIFTGEVHPKSISSATATVFSFLIVLLPLKHSNADRKTIKANLHLM